MNYTYFVIPIEEIHKALLDECKQEFKTMRTNHAGTHAILKTLNPELDEFANYIPLTHTQSLDLMLTDDWKDPSDSILGFSIWTSIKNWFA